jgi:hypothetical protein
MDSAPRSALGGEETTRVPIFRFIALAFAKTFSKIFGIATVSFLGRVPSRDGDKVAFVGLMSLTWFALLVAIIVPAAAELLMPGLPDDDETIRWLAVGGAILVPMINGLVIGRFHNRDEGPAAVVKHVVYGFGYSTAIGAIVGAIIVVVPILRGSYLIRQFDVKHIAVMIHRDAYDDVVEAVQESLREEGIETEMNEPHFALRRLFDALAWLLGRIFHREYVAHDMKSIRGEMPDGDGEDDQGFEIIVHAADISVIGKKRATTAIAAVLSERLLHPKVYFSWDDQSQEIEDRIHGLWEQLREGEKVEAGEVDEIRHALHHISLSTEEWNAIRRLLYRVELEAARSDLLVNDSGEIRVEGRAS